MSHLRASSELVQRLPQLEGAGVEVPLLPPRGMLTPTSPCSKTCCSQLSQHPRFSKRHLRNNLWLSPSADVRVRPATAKIGLPSVTWDVADSLNAQSTHKGTTSWQQKLFVSLCHCGRSVLELSRKRRHIRQIVVSTRASVRYLVIRKFFYMWNSDILLRCGGLRFSPRKSADTLRDCVRADRQASCNCITNCEGLCLSHEREVQRYPLNHGGPKHLSHRSCSQRFFICQCC